MKQFIVPVLVVFAVISSVDISRAQSGMGVARKGKILENYDFGAQERLAPRFRTFYVTWGATEKAEFSKYLEETRPDVVQAGWYGPMFYGYVEHKQSTGYPMQLPIAGVESCLSQWKEMHEKIRAHGGKSVAHFTVTNVIRGPEKDDESKAGYFADWYTREWPEHLLGTKPAPAWTDLVSKDGLGNVLIDRHYVQYNSLCVNNPATRQMLKSMVRAAIRNGADGFMTTYNYRRACACEHCQVAFKDYLQRSYTSAEIRQHFQIEDLSAFVFEKIPGQTPGYPSEGDVNALTLAAHQWSTMAYKAAWDEIFLKEGRDQKPDLILGQWNHLGNVGVTEERSFLPIQSFAKGENYLWYSGNHYNVDVKPGDDNDGWLNGLYLRALAGDKPYVIGRYDGVRLRVGQAEAMALGGAGTGLNQTVTDPAAYAVLRRYLNFAKAHEHDVLDTHVRGATGQLQKPLQPKMVAETCLVIPRQSAWAGRKQSFDTFRKVGTELVRRQQPIQMISDEVLRVDPESDRGIGPEITDLLSRSNLDVGGGLNAFRVVVLPEVLGLTDSQVQALERWMRLRPDNKMVIIGDVATLDNKGRPWAIAGPESVPRMAWLAGFEASRVVRIGVDELANGSIDWKRVKPLESSARTDGEPRLSAFEIWIEREGRRVALDEPNSLRVAWYRHPEGRYVLHVVNYGRDVVTAKGFKKSNPDAELPIASAPLWLKVRSGGGFKVDDARVFSPDVASDGSPEDVSSGLETDAEGNRWIRVGAVSVYRVVALEGSSTSE